MVDKNSVKDDVEFIPSVNSDVDDLDEPLTTEIEPLDIEYPRSGKPLTDDMDIIGGHLSEEISDIPLPTEQIKSKLNISTTEPLTTEINPEDVVDIQPLEEPSFFDKLKLNVVGKDKSEKRDWGFDQEPESTVPESTVPESTVPESVKESISKEKAKDEKSTNSTGEKVTNDLFTKEPTSRSKDTFTWERAKQSLFGTPDEMEYARKGGYFGQDKNVLQSDIDSLRDENRKYHQIISDSESMLASYRDRRDRILDKKDKKPSDYDALNDIRQKIKEEEARKKYAEDRIRINESNIENIKGKISRYEQAIEAGKLKQSKEPSRVRKTLHEIGTETSKIKSGTENIGKQDWFGPKGFLKAPYKQSAITSNIVEPVRGGSSKLGSYTRMTGQSVKGGIGEALTTIRSNKIISPMGVPGTVAGSKQQFDQRIPLRTIPLSSLNKSNVNPAILPSIYDVKPQIQVAPVEYKQVIQPDGSIINVPISVQPQRRDSKIIKVSANRYNLSGRNLNISTPRHKISLVTSPSISKIKCEPRKNYIVSHGFSGVSDIETVNKVFEINLGSPRTIKAITIGDRPEISLGLISADQTGTKLHLPNEKDNSIIEKSKYRKPKKNSALVNLDISSRIVNNVNKITSIKKKKH